MTPIADHRIALGSVATVGVSFTDQEGDPTTAGTVTVGVTDLAGDTVVAAGSATTTITSDTSVRRVTLPRAEQLDLWTATWTDTTTNGAVLTTVTEVVGGFYASPTAIRGSDPTLTDDGKYPDPLVVHARRAVEDEFEHILGYACVPRIAVHEERITTSDCRAVLPHMYVDSVRTATLDGVALDTTLWGDEGVITFSTGNSGLLRVVYLHGLERPNAEILDAFYTRVRDVLNRTHRGIKDRATTYTSEVGGTYSLAVAGRGGSMTGIPDVDVVLRRHMKRTQGFGG